MKEREDAKRNKKKRKLTKKENDKGVMNNFLKSSQVKT